MANVFHTKAGWLTDYALSLGYRETFEHGLFKAKLAKHAGCKAYTVTENDDSMRIAYSGPSLTKARQVFMGIKQSVLSQGVRA